MPSNVSNAIGTQRQFMAQPQGVYQQQLQTPRFGSGIGESTDADAELLARSLGVLGNNLQAEADANEKRMKEQFTDDAAQRMIAGKTPEELAKFDRVTALQHSDAGYDLTDNPYAMAALERSIGRVAAASASSSYASSATGVPNSIQEAVKGYEDASQATYDQFKDSVKNKFAFEQGFKDSMFQETAKVAENARKQIADNARSKGLRVTGVKLNNLIADSGAMDATAFRTNYETILREAQLYSKDPEDVIKLVQGSLDNFTMNETTTEKLEALKDVKFFGDSKIGEEIDLTKAYKQVAKNATKKMAEDIIKAATRADGTIDLAVVAGLKGSKVKPSTGIPQVNLKVSKADAPDLEDLNPDLKGALGSIGGILYTSGLSDVAEITSGYRDAERNAAAGGVNNSNHLQGNAVDIYVGNLSQEEQDSLTDKFKDYFGEVLYHDSGSGLHLHLGAYQGGLDASRGVDDPTAGLYDPDRADVIQKIAEGRAADVVAIKRQKEDEATNAIYEKIYTSSNADAYEAINNSDLPAKKKLELRNIVDRRVKQAEKTAKTPMSSEHKMWSSYEKSLSGLWADKRLVEEMQTKYTDAEAIITDDEQAKYDKAAARLTAYWNYTMKGESAFDSKSQEASPESTDSEPESEPEDDTSEKDIVNVAESYVAEGKSKDAIIRAVRKLATDKGYDANTIIKQINWQRTSGD